MLQASIGWIPRHGEERHLVRPDRVYGTGVLTAIPGFQPVQNAMEVAQRFTAIWPPMVSDVATAATVSPGGSSIPSSTVVTTTPALHGAFGAPTLMQRFRLWAARRALKKALARRGLKGLGAGAWNPHGARVTYGQVPVVGGYEPLTPTMTQTAFAMPQTPFAPVYQPSQGMAAQIAAIAGQPAELSQQLVQQAIGGLVGQRASNQALANFYSLNNMQPWGAIQ